MGAPYHQFCPVAKAMELLDERWTMLVMRELVSGSERFNDLRRGLPRMSPALLSRRLHQLHQAGLVERRGDGRDTRYLVTVAGRELTPIIESLGAWGVRWIGELGDEDLDPRLLMWDMHRRIDYRTVPTGRTVIGFHFTGVRPSLARWWLVLTDGDADVCDVDPGFPVAISVSTSLRTMTEIWRGDLPWAHALRSGTLSVEGPTDLQRRLPGWLSLSIFAGVARPAHFGQAGDDSESMTPAGARRD